MSVHSREAKVREALKPYTLKNRRILRSSQGHAYTMADSKDQQRYLYDDHTIDENSSVESRAPTREVVKYGNLLLTRDVQATETTHDKRLACLEEALAMPESEASARQRTLQHLGLVAVLPSEAKGSIIPIKLPKTATVEASTPRLDNVA